MFHGKKTLSVTADAVPALPKGELYECKPSDAKELPLSGGAGERSETERVYQSIVVFVRPTPMTAVLIFFQLLQPHTPSTVRLVRRW